MTKKTNRIIKEIDIYLNQYNINDMYQYMFKISALPEKIKPVESFCTQSIKKIDTQIINITYVIDKSMNQRKVLTIATLRVWVKVKSPINGKK